MLPVMDKHLLTSINAVHAELPSSQEAVVPEPPVPPTRLQGSPCDPGLSGGRAALYRRQRLLAHTADRWRAGCRCQRAAAPGTRPDLTGGDRPAALEAGAGPAGGEFTGRRNGPPSLRLNPF